MNGDTFNFEICISVCRLIRYGKAVVFDLSNTENEVQFRTNEVLQHCANVICSTTVGLDFFRLLKKFFNVGLKRLAGIKIKFWPLRRKMSFHFLDPPSQRFIQICHALSM